MVVNFSPAETTALTWHMIEAGHCRSLAHPNRHPTLCHVPVVVLLETLQASPARIGSEDGKTLTQRISLPRDRRRSFRAYDAPRYKSLTDNPKLKPKRGTVCTRLHLETARNAQIGHVASVR